ncbi:MAG: kelch repeat-containing protein [Planctomycetota bacterium]
MMLPRSLSALVLAAVALAAPASDAQSMYLDIHGGGLGQTVELNLSGPPSTRYLLLMSFVYAPTPFPGQPVGSIDVGLELLNTCLALPGFFGYLPTSGQLTLPIPVPNNPPLDGANLNFQLLRVIGNKATEKSNPWRLTFDTPGDYTATIGGGLAQARAFATNTELDDGTVLIAGGGTGSITSATGLSSVELYRPNLEAFASMPAMNSARALHKATKLLDGRVLITGGVDAGSVPLASAEVYDPVTGTSTFTANMQIARAAHTSTLLPDGRVLITGGSSDLSTDTSFATSAERSTEIFNPGTMSFASGPNMSEPKTFHDATVLSNGNVLVTGGITYYVIFIKIPDLSNTAQVYTPGTAPAVGSFGSSIGMGTKRAAHTSVLLDDGRVLVAGGASGSLLAPTILSSCSLFTGSGFSAAGGMATPRAISGLVKLENGQVLAAGGANGDLLNPSAIISCELYTPAPPSGAGSWASAGNMTTSRSGQGALLLSDGTIGLIAGGGGVSNVALSSAEIYQP